MRRTLSRLILTVSLALAAPAAQAFCGFYVARADGALYNRSSTVVYTRVNETSVITMASDYTGSPAEFAMIVPTPKVLDRSQVQTVPSETVAHLDRYTAPRLVEYFDYDPCAVDVMMEPEVVMEAEPGTPTRRERREGARALGVTIEREFAVGSYDIQMLSARQSDGLAEFLRSEGYKLPEGAEAALQGYITGGMKFFVAKVNLARHSAKAAQELEPLQISFRSPNFMLPIQLGKLNGDGPQDLIVLALTRKGRVKLTNYMTKDIPTDIQVPVFVQQVFPQFYRAMIDKQAPKNGAFLEYAWDMSWCDPCADDPLSYDEFRQLGVVWVSKAEAATPNVFVTRLHIRYSKGSFFEDLKFAVTDDRENFQGTYVMNHPFDGEITCEEGKEYVAQTRQRLKDEAATLRDLTGWSAKNIASNIAKTTDRRYR
ncbi:DUF2330 domain-containing protein [Tabrizicola sp.]|uniref:DUF2330 domain-containing protein n=1 Tax=Tabrizicola sp. TaxID=2005166 RepID=UPI00286B15BD|nr:DUF2330 domain-containing protein [Tabrizicola sp.]